MSSPIARSVSYFTSHSTAGLGAFYVNIDHIGMGCLLAFWRKRLHTVETYMRVLQSKLFLLVPAFILWATCQGNHPSIHRTVLLFPINVSIALCTIGRYKSCKRCRPRTEPTPDRDRNPELRLYPGSSRFELQFEHPRAQFPANESRLGSRLRSRVRLPVL